jgi:hypothetical protein
MGVSTEIAQHIFRPSEGPLGVDHPIVAEQHSQPRTEGARLCQRQISITSNVIIPEELRCCCKLPWGGLSVILRASEVSPLPGSAMTFASFLGSELLPQPSERLRLKNLAGALPTDG